MVKVYLYTSRHQSTQSTILRNKLIAEEIAFEEIDVAVQDRKHPTLSCIPSIIIEKDEVEVERFEEREEPVDVEAVKTFLLSADDIDTSDKLKQLESPKDEWRKAQTIEEKLLVLAKVMNLV